MRDLLLDTTGRGLVPSVAEVPPGGERPRVLSAPEVRTAIAAVDSTPRRMALACKRALDILGALVFLVLLSPVLLGIAVVVRRSGEGPVLFRSRRMGRNG